MGKVLLLTLCVALATSAGVPSKAARTERSTRNASHQKMVCDTYPCIVFEDNFDTLDFNKWEHEITAGGGGNWEFQYYTNNRSNSYAHSGKLFIKPTLTTEKYGPNFLNTGTLDLWGNHPPNLCTGNAWYGCLRGGNDVNYINPIQSARLRTASSFSVKYGRVEIVAKMPKGDWIWPAIWLLPKHEQYGGWPASGEIDIVESRGNANLRDASNNLMGQQHAGQTLHWGPFFPFNRFEMTAAGREGNWADAFHTYAVEWDENFMELSIDGDVLVRVDPPAGGWWQYGNFESQIGPETNPWKYGSKMAPFDQEYYIILNVAVGGTNGFFPDTWTNTPYPKPWLNTSPTGPRDFWQAINNWYPTWTPTVNNGEDAALQIESVIVRKMHA